MSERSDSLEMTRDAPNVIVGMGPGGLAAALELAEAGHRVLILEKREHFTRGQKVKLDLKTVEHLLKMIDRKDYPLAEEFKEKIEQDEDFLEELSDGGGVIEISKIQECLKRQLEKYPDLITPKQSDENVKIAVTGLETAQHKLQYTENGETHEVSFKHLIAADGAGRATAKMAGFGEQFVPNAFQPRQETHGALTLELRGGAELRLKKKRELNFDDLAELQREPFHWDKPYLPRVYAWPDKSGKIYMAGEVPSACLRLKGEAQQKALENWAKIVLAKTYQYKKEEIGLSLSSDATPEDIEKNKLKATAFQVTLKHAVASAHECSPKTPGEHALIQIGDAGRDANFFVGHGAIDAIEDAIAVAACMGENGFDVRRFQARHDEVVKKIDNGTRTVSRQDREGILDEIQLNFLGYHQLTDNHKQKFEESIKEIRENILPCITDKKQRKKINKEIKKIESLAKKNKYDEVFVLTEKLFDDVHMMLMNDIEHFSKSLPALAAETENKKSSFFKGVSNWFNFVSKATQEAPKVSGTQSDHAVAKQATTKANDDAVTKTIESKVKTLYQFRRAGKSLAELAKLHAGERLLDEKPPGDHSAQGSSRHK